MRFIKLIIQHKNTMKPLQVISFNNLTRSLSRSFESLHIIVIILLPLHMIDGHASIYVQLIICDTWTVYMAEVNTLKH